MTHRIKLKPLQTAAPSTSTKTEKYGANKCSLDLAGSPVRVSAMLRRHFDEDALKGLAESNQELPTRRNRTARRAPIAKTPKTVMKSLPANGAGSAAAARGLHEVPVIIRVICRTGDALEFGLRSKKYPAAVSIAARGSRRLINACCSNLIISSRNFAKIIGKKPSAHYYQYDPASLTLLPDGVKQMIEQGELTVERALIIPVPDLFPALGVAKEIVKKRASMCGRPKHSLNARKKNLKFIKRKSAGQSADVLALW